MSEYLLATHGLTKQFGHHKAVGERKWTLF